MSDPTTTPADLFTITTDATVEARRFLAGVKPRRLRTDGGRQITTAQLAENLVRRAALEHAVVPGKRPTEVLCKDCKGLIRVKPSGHVPKLCAACRPKRGTTICITAACNNIVTRRSKSGMCIPCTAATTLAKVHERRTPDQYRESASRARDALAKKRASGPRPSPARTRPTTVACQRCGEPIRVAPTGHIPKRCGPVKGRGHRDCLDRERVRRFGQA